MLLHVRLSWERSPRAIERTRVALMAVQGMEIEILTWDGDMGG